MSHATYVEEIKHTTILCSGNLPKMVLCMKIMWDCGSTVVKVLRYKSEGRCFDSRWCHWNISLTLSFRSHYGPGVDSASNRNEYLEYFLGRKGGSCVRLTTYHHPVSLTCNMGTLTSWNPLGTSGL